MSEAVIRDARPDDALAVQRIYAFHVAHGTASFDTEAPNAEFWREKIAYVMGKGWPFLVVELDDEVVGHAYATQFRDRAAYAHTCENSIYIADEIRGKGIGTQLLKALIEAAVARKFEQMIAVIGGGEAASVALHSRCDFEHAGRMRKVGFKFGRKLDTVYMQCDLIAKGKAE